LQITQKTTQYILPSQKVDKRKEGFRGLTPTMTMTNPIIPYSLVMCPMACSICGKKMSDGAYSAHVSRLFGIQHCEEHGAQAERNVCAYMHKNKVVRMADTYTHPQIKPLFDILRSGVSIKRSNGMMDPGWKIEDDPFSTPNLIRQQEDGGWYATFGKEQLTKGYVINTLFNEVQSEYLPILNTAISAMNEGIYKAAAN